MIFADKLIKLRKKNGWSQEELAEKMNVSRQAVSKWESAQSVPDLTRMIALADIFGVTTDYLLKDEIETESFTDSDTLPNGKCVSMEEAHRFLQWRKKAAVRIASGTFLCIFSCIPLFLLLCTTLFFPAFSETIALFLGLVFMAVLVCIAVALFLSCGAENAPYAYLDKDVFSLEYGVSGMVKQQQESYRGVYSRCNIIGACICILAPILLFSGILFDHDAFYLLCVCIALFAIAIGITFFIVGGVRWASMEKLLQEGDFSPREKKVDRIRGNVSSLFWPLAAAVYLAWSFLGDAWQISWIVWPVAGGLYAAIMALCPFFVSSEDE